MAQSRNFGIIVDLNDKHWTEDNDLSYACDHSGRGDQLFVLFRR